MSGCVLRLVLLPVTVLLLYPLFCLRLPFPTFVFPADGAEVAAAVTGLFLWWAIISWMDRRDIGATLKLAKQWDLRDGARAVVAGFVEARERTLTAPFSGEPCIGYRYTITHPRRDAEMNTKHWTDFEGFALAPCIVRGPMRTVNVLARPNEELFAEVPARGITRDEDWVRAEKFLESTDFGPPPKGPLGDTRTQLLENGPGDFREDKQVGDPPRDLRGHKPAEGADTAEQGPMTLTEAIVREGDSVLVAGVYRADGDGIAPDPDDVMHPFRIVVGAEQALGRKRRNRLVGVAVAGSLAVVTAVMYFQLFA